MGLCPCQSPLQECRLFKSRCVYHHVWRQKVACLPSVSPDTHAHRVSLAREPAGWEQWVGGLWCHGRFGWARVAPESLRREEIATIDSVRFGTFLWFAVIRLPLTSCAVKLAALTYGLDLLHRREGGSLGAWRQNPFLLLPASLVPPPHLLSSARLAARAFVTRHCDLVCFLSPSLEDARRRSIPEVSLLPSEGVGLHQVLSECLGNK